MSRFIEVRCSSVTTVMGRSKSAGKSNANKALVHCILRPAPLARTHLVLALTSSKTGRNQYYTAGVLGCTHSAATASDAAAVAKRRHMTHSL